MSQRKVVAQLIPRLQPLSGWTAGQRLEITPVATLVRMEAGHLACREGDTDRFCVWLIKGSVETLSGGQQVCRIDAGTDMALSPIAENQPRTLSVRTLSEAGLLRIPRNRIIENTEVPGESASGIAFSELDDNDDSADDWMTMLLRSPPVQPLAGYPYPTPDELNGSHRL